MPGLSIQGNGTWYKQTNIERYASTVFAVNGSSLTITANNTQNALFGFLKSYNPVSGQHADLSEGTTRIAVVQGRTATYSIPEDAKFIYLMVTNEYQDALPSKIVLDGFNLYDNLARNLSNLIPSKEFYFSADGDDNNSGTEDKPKKNPSAFFT